MGRQVGDISRKDVQDLCMSLHETPVATARRHRCCPSSWTGPMSGVIVLKSRTRAWGSGATGATAGNASSQSPDPGAQEMSSHCMFMVDQAVENVGTALAACQVEPAVSLFISRRTRSVKPDRQRWSSDDASTALPPGMTPRRWLANSPFRFPSTDYRPFARKSGLAASFSDRSRVCYIVSFRVKPSPVSW